MSLPGWTARMAVVFLASAGLVAPASGQFAERSALFGSGEAGIDVSGRSVKNPRVRAVHTTDPALEGGTAHLFAMDPFLAYQLGRNLNFREFRERDGTFSVGGSQLLTGLGNLAGPMPDDTTAKITAQNQASCTACHNQPYGNPGGGINFAKDSGRGRNSPHYFGAGLMEMLAIQVRAEILAQLDTDGSGWISEAEAAASNGSVLVRPTPGAQPLDFGDPRIDPSTGRPRFNNHIKVWYVDANGQWVDDAVGVDGVNTRGYNLQLQIWGWGQGIERELLDEETGFLDLEGGAAVNPTNRAFLWDPWDTHGGLEAFDPSTLDDPENDGVSTPTLAGAIQFPATHQPPDKGPPIGGGAGFSPYSLGDPDNDGYQTEISEGDLDLAEWFMLNLPAPAFAGTPAEYDAGVALLEAWDCTSCHVADWTIKARARRPKLKGTGMTQGGGGSVSTGPAPRYVGDRRFFELDVTWDDGEGRLEGKLEKLYDVQGDGTHQRRFGAFRVDGLFSDLRQHEMGEGFAEFAYDGSVQTLWRTAPLWGVGTGFPWGHDGASLSLRDVIDRHGGDAEASRALFDAASSSAQEALLDFLRRLVLYDIETLAADIDGDGAIVPHYVVGGMDTGPERFNAEWLFGTPVSIQGPVINGDGEALVSFAATNLAAAYGLELDYRKDTDGDGWPDVWDPQPTQPGFKNGVND